ncbi:MAG TPA: NYN domain-containing protein [Longimicrobiales bacterium]|nr:NYN domain-containing protein [Longimicrobiales bacterium]
MKKVLGQRLRRFPSPEDVMAEVSRILADPALGGHSLYRVFYYSADPLSGVAQHPLSGDRVDFAQTSVFSLNSRLIDRIENQPDVAVRRGTLVHQGWELGRSAIRAMVSGSKTSVGVEDVVPKIQQKGVDMRIGLDIAALAFKRLVSTIVVVTGDSDLVPAMKLARREGLRVHLDPLGRRQVRDELKVHADRVL